MLTAELYGMVRAFIMERVRPSDFNEVEIDRILSMVTMRIASLNDFLKMDGVSSLISALVCYCMVGLLSPFLSKAFLKGSPELPLPHTGISLVKPYLQLKIRKPFALLIKERPYLGFVELSLELESSFERVLVHRA